MDTPLCTTPLRKLVRFFQSSRDGWKAKCQQAKKECKKLANQARAVQKSRQHWKAVARQRQQEIRELQKQLSQEKNSA